MYKIYTVCVNGMGSSLILRMTVEKAVQELGIDAQVKAIDLGQLKGMKPDICITSPFLAKSIEKREGMTIISTTSFTDVEAMKQKLKQALSL